MRNGAYQIFEIVAWPAAAWCAIEIGLRAVAGIYDGFSATAMTGGFAALTIAACRMRTRQLASARIPARD